VPALLLASSITTLLAGSYVLATGASKTAGLVLLGVGVAEGIIARMLARR
jgi:hypothetical protein